MELEGWPLNSDICTRVVKSVKRYTILKFALKILHEILHQHFFLKSQDAPLKQKIIARLKKKVVRAFALDVGEGSNLQLFHPSANLQKSSFLKVGDF